jgi:hypothetical protein
MSAEQTIKTMPTAGITLVVIDIQGSKMFCTCVEDGQKMWVPLIQGVEIGTVLRNVQFIKS